MSAAASPNGRIPPVHRAIDELGLSLDDLCSWAQCLRQLGVGPNDIAGDTVRVIGDALDSLHGGLEAERETLADLVAPNHPAAFRNRIASAQRKPREDATSPAAKAPDRDAALVAACHELDALKDWQNSCDLGDADPRLKASDDRDTVLCELIAGTEAFTARGLAAKARATAREYGFRRPLAEAEAGPDDRDKLLLSLIRDVLRGPASADWQRLDA